MDSKQINKAMYNKTPVYYNGIKYERILEYVMWYDDKNSKKLSCVLLECNKHATIRVPADKVYMEE